MTEQGGRINDLQKLVKVRAITRDLPGNANRTAGLRNPQKLSTFQAFLHTPMAGAAIFKPITQTYLKAYEIGWPSTLGFLGMYNDNNKFWNFPQLSRAGAMGSQIHPHLVEGVSNTYDYGNEKINQIQEWLNGLDQQNQSLMDYDSSK